MIESGCDRRMAPIQPVLGVGMGEYIQLVGLNGVNDTLSHIVGRHAAITAAFDHARNVAQGKPT